MGRTGSRRPDGPAPTRGRGSPSAFKGRWGWPSPSRSVRKGRAILGPVGPPPLPARSPVAARRDPGQSDPAPPERDGGRDRGRRDAARRALAADDAARPRHRLHPPGPGRVHREVFRDRHRAAPTRLCRRRLRLARPGPVGPRACRAGQGLRPAFRPLRARPRGDPGERARALHAETAFRARAIRWAARSRWPRPASGGCPSRASSRRRRCSPCAWSKSPKVAAATALLLRLAGLGGPYMPGGGATSIATKPFAGNRLTSDPVRYARNADIAAALGDGAIGDPTMAWLDSAFRFMRKFADPRFPLEVRTPDARGRGRRRSGLRDAGDRALRRAAEGRARDRAAGRAPRDPDGARRDPRGVLGRLRRLHPGVGGCDASIIQPVEERERGLVDAAVAGGDD